MTVEYTMKRATLLLAGLATAACALPASAHLILDAGLTANGTGLGAVPTVVTVLDNGAQGNGIESGCISANGAGSNFNCLNGLQGGDNQAINNLILASSLAGLNNAGQLALVVNINEPGNDHTAVLTDLYMSFYSLAGVLLGNHQYTGADLTITQGTGLGSAGTVFTLDAAEQAQAMAECPVLSQCRIGAGIQFAEGTTDGGPESLYVSFVPGSRTTQAVPEPATLMLTGLALAGLGFSRRKTAA